MEKNKILKLISQLKVENKMFEATMLQGKNEDLDELVQEISRSFYCLNTSFLDDNCQNCKQFSHHQILDFHSLGNHFEAINKEMIKTIIDGLSESAFGINQPKIVVIKNAENLKIDAANSLLKFLEEPTKNTYFFLLTNDSNQVLSTIKSRSKIINLSSTSNPEVKDNFIINVINNHQKDNILLMNNKMKKLPSKELIQLLDEGKRSFLNQQKITIYELCLQLINDLRFSNNPNLAIDYFLIKVVGEL